MTRRLAPSDPEHLTHTILENRMRRFFVLLLLAVTARSQADFYLKDGDRVVTTVATAFETHLNVILAARC